MMNAEQEIHIKSAAIKTTNRCNFQCGHCGLGDSSEATDMTPSDMHIVMDRINGPFLNQVVLEGGEPRVNEALPEMIGVIRDHVHKSGRSLVIETKKEDVKSLCQELRIERDSLIQTLPWEKRQQMEKTGELDAFVDKQFLTSGKIQQLPVSIEVYTNGSGMSSLPKVKAIAQELGEHGVDSITISCDKPHQDYAQEHRIPIDYSMLRNIIIGSSQVSGEKGEPEILGKITFFTSGNGAYVLPIGRAKNFSWDKRIAMGFYSHDDSTKTREGLQKKLAEEFENWLSTTSYTHRYCGPAKIRRLLMKVKNYAPQYRVAVAGVVIEANMDVNPCAFNIVPPLGNLEKQSVKELLNFGAQSKLYTILDQKGPQGLAEILTKKSQKEIKEQFIERTPCGLCEDLVFQYPQDIENMLHT